MPRDGASGLGAQLTHGKGSSAEGKAGRHAEDAADDIEVLIANAVLTNQVTANWNQASYGGPTMLDDVTIGGVDFLRELIQVELEVLA